MQYRLFFIFHANESLADNKLFSTMTNWACLACAFRQLDHNLRYDRTNRALNIFQIISAQITYQQCIVITKYIRNLFVEHIFIKNVH